MSLLTSLTVKSLLYACALLALLLVMSNALWWLHASALGLQRDVAAAGRTAAQTERDAWKDKADELQAANHSAQSAINTLQAELKAAQGEQRRLRAAGQQAVAAAQADAVDADRALKDFVNRYAAQTSKPDCAGALAALQRMCPAMEGY